MDNIPPPPKIFLPPKEQEEMSPKGIVIFFTVLLLTIIIASIGYSYINKFVPLLVVKVLIPFGYVFILGYFMSWGIYLGKIKGIKNIMILALIGTTISTYSLWCIWTAVNLGEPMFSQFWSLFQGIDNIGFDGIYLKGEKVAGTGALKTIWIIETIFIFLVPIFLIGEKPPSSNELREFAENT